MLCALDQGISVVDFIKSLGFKHFSYSHRCVLDNMLNLRRVYPDMSLVVEREVQPQFIKQPQF